MHQGKLKVLLYRSTKKVLPGVLEAMRDRISFVWSGRILQFAVFMALVGLIAANAHAQDWIRTGTGLGVEKVRLAAADFKPTTQDPNTATLLKAFNDTLWNDLDNAGIFEMVSKSFYPTDVPGNPSEVHFDAWSSPPPNASMLAFGDFGATGNSLLVHGWLYDVKNVGSPQVLGKQYTDAATADAARTIAHKFADEIIFRLGGGVPGIAESKIYFVSDRGGHKEIWAMDYDGSNQHQVTHLGSISLSPRISPDGTRLAFSSLTKTSWENPDVLGRPEPARVICTDRWDESIADVVARRGEGGVLVVTGRRIEYLHCGCWRRKPAPLNQRSGTGCGADVQSQDGRADCIRQRTHRSAADLHDGSRRHERAEGDGPGLRRVAVVVAEWPVSGAGMVPEIWTGGAGCERYLPDGYREQAVGATHARWRPE